MKTAAMQQGPRLRQSTIQAAALTVIIAAAVAVTHWPALSSTVISFDDTEYLTENTLVLNPRWAHVWRFLTEVLKPSTVGGYYQPLTMISLMLDSAMGGDADHLGVYHRTSLLLHVANTCLVLWILLLLFHQAAPAAIAALLFGAHPLTVETIPWIGERKTLLAAFFALAGILCYIQFARRRSLGWYSACAALFVLALMSKPTTTPLPAALLLMDAWPLRRLSWRAVLEKIPLLLIAVVSAPITYLSQAQTSHVTTPEAQGIARIFYLICHNIVFYLHKIVWPVELTSHYPLPSHLDFSMPMVRAGVMGTLGLFVLLIVSLRWTRAICIGWLVFFVMIFPTLGVVGFTTVIASDKFVYLPAIGLLLPLTYGLSYFWKVGISGAQVALHRGIVVASAILLSCLEIRATRQYLFYWRDTERLFRYMADLTPDAPIVQNHLALALEWNKKYVDAIEHYERAINLAPNWHKPRVGLGVILLNAGMSDSALVDKAIEQFTAALRIAPDYPHALVNLGIALKLKGRTGEAIEYYRRGLSRRPRDPVIRYNLANALLDLKRYDEAIAEFAEALRLRPKYVKVHINWASALVEQGKLEEAMQHYEAALALSPRDAHIYQYMAVALARQGKLVPAIAAMQQAVRLAPDDADSQFNLGVLLEQNSQRDAAVDSFKRALKCDPSHKGARAAMDAIEKSRKE